jgi:hypothetical protein
MKGFTADQRRRFVDALDRAGATMSCPRCDNAELALADGYINEHIQAERGNLVIGGDNRLLSIALICMRCGFIAQHKLSVLERRDSMS